MRSSYEFHVEAKMHFFLHPEEYRVEPFRIYGNLYYVGNQSVGSYLVDTGDGLILIDTTYPTTVSLLVHSIWSLGFSPKDIRMILHTHGHFDHIGGTVLLKALSGAKTIMSAEDAKMLRERPALALAEFCPCAHTQLFVPDRELKEKDEVRLGNTVIRTVLTPGHSDGVISLFFDVTEKGKTLRAGLQGGAGLNTLCRPFIERYHRERARAEFLEGISRIYEEPVDINLGNHAGQNHTLEKRKEMLEHPGGKNPFIDPTEWKRYLDSVRRRYTVMLEEEQRGTDIEREE